MDKLKILLIIVLCILFGLYVYEKNRYPVIFKMCLIDYTDCSEIARFKERDDCETTKQKWGWYCNTTNKSNIVCQEKDSAMVTGCCD
jgi:hypothetical protein